MENLTNSTPEESKLELDNAAVDHLAETRKWTMFLSILGFIFTGLMLIFAIILATVSGYYARTGMTALTIIPFLLLCLIYIFPIYYLFRFSTYSKQALDKKDNGLLSMAFGYLKMHYRFMGILMIVIGGIYILIILVMIVAGSFFNVFHS
jgi:hypothetical protein